MTTKPGKWVYVGADRRQVAKVEVFVSLPVEPLVPSGEGPTERMLFGRQLVGLFANDDPCA